MRRQGALDACIEEQGGRVTVRGSAIANNCGSCSSDGDNQDRRCSDDTDIDISRDNHEITLVLDVGC